MQKNFANSLFSQALLLGQVADDSLNQIDSYISELSVNQITAGVTGIKFGQPVQLGTDMETQVQPCDDITKFVGIAIRTNIQPSASVLQNETSDYSTIIKWAINEYPNGAMLGVLKFGRIAVNIDVVTNGASNTPVWYNVTDFKITTALANPSTNDCVQIGKLITNNVTANSLAVIQVNKL